VKDFTEFASGPLRLPYGGKLYEIPPVSITTGLLLRRALDPEDVQAIQALSGKDELDGYRMVLGSALDEMVADGCSWDFMDRAYLTAVTDHQRGRVIAEAVWEVGHDPKALRASIQAAARIARSGVVSESRTPKPANSRRTTTSRGAKRKRKG
jgi:hypothetical protein